MITIICPCGRKITTTLCRAKRKKYCSKKCFYKYRKRPKGLKYKIIFPNKGWFKKGHVPWTKGKKGIMKANSGSIKKGEHKSVKTEFKYKNGNGYRHLFAKGLLPMKCEQCDETNLKRLQVHHIDKNRLNNKLNNLMVLCRPHHLLLHNKKEKYYMEGKKI